MARLKPRYFLLLGLIWAVTAQAKVTVSSPNKEIQAKVRFDPQGRLVYTLEKGGQPICADCRLGIFLDDQDLGRGSQLLNSQSKYIQETYATRGVHNLANNHCQEVLINLRHQTTQIPWQVQMRIYNDGMAYRYVIASDKTHVIQGEASSWFFAPEATVWYQTNLSCYEGIYQEARLGDLKPGLEIGPPLTLRLPQGPGYAVVTEGNLVNYSGMALRVTEQSGLQAYFHDDPKDWKHEGPFKTPWRLTIISDDLNGLVNSDMVTNVCPPPSAELDQADWIQPGRSVWQWWSVGSPKLEEQTWWIDRTRDMGAEYYLIDDGWRLWQTEEKGCWDHLADVVAYAKKQGVGIWLWCHNRYLRESITRRPFLEKAKAIGVLGVKIDFMNNESVAMMQWYEETLAEAALLQMMVNFHGTSKPTGRSRTWPHEMTREGVRAQEYHITRYNRTLPFAHDTILPFTRYIAGHGDYTPCVFELKEMRGYSWAHELAETAIFTSPVLHYADNPANYLSNPAVDLLKAIPPVRDVTVVLPGSKIGQCAAFARRHGDTWFVAVINGPQARALDIKLDFLGDQTYSSLQYGDDSQRADGYTVAQGPVTQESVLKINLRTGGGYLGRFVLQP